MSNLELYKFAAFFKPTNIWVRLGLMWFLLFQNIPVDHLKPMKYVGNKIPEILYNGLGPKDPLT